MSKVLYELPELPYEYDALAPVISEEIMKLHHDKHHAAYVKGANDALEKLEAERKDPKGIDIKSVMKALSFNLNGHILHSLFWESMRAPQETNKPSAELEEFIADQFGSLDAFKAEFSAAAKAVEANGWAVLFQDEWNNLFVSQIENQNKLALVGLKPILMLDVWEHAYYLDYKNDRGAYVDAWWKVVDWDVVETRIAECNCMCECCDDCEDCGLAEGSDHASHNHAHKEEDHAKLEEGVEEKE